MFFLFEWNALKYYWEHKVEKQTKSSKNLYYIGLQSCSTISTAVPFSILLQGKYRLNRLTLKCFLLKSIVNTTFYFILWLTKLLKTLTIKNG